MINELTSRKQNNFHVKEVLMNDTLLHDPEKLSEAFNNHFATIGPKLAEKFPYHGEISHLDYLKNRGHSDNFQLKETNPGVVLSLLSRLCKSKATGLDKISAKLLRICPDLIAKSLCAIFNRLITTRYFSR